MPTNLCFGGPDLCTAFITLSTTGRLVAMDWPEPGLTLN
jgi:gluconolactonase